MEVDRIGLVESRKEADDSGLVDVMMEVDATGLVEAVRPADAVDDKMEVDGGLLVKGGTLVDMEMEVGAGVLVDVVGSGSVVASSPWQPYRETPSKDSALLKS